MPSVLLSRPWLVTCGFLGFVLLLTAAVHIQARAAHRPVALYRPHDADLYNWIVIAATLLMLVFTIGRSFARTTYYNVFLLDALYWPLGTAWFIAMLLAGVTSGSIMTLENRLWERWILAILCVVFALAGVWWTTTMSQRIIDQFIALQVGPLVDSGVVSAKNVISGRTRLQFADIGGYHYEVPDYTWWRTLRVGQPIEFARDPAHTLAFARGQIGWTWFAAGLTAIGTLLWLWTFGFMAIQYLARVSSFRRA